MSYIGLDANSVKVLVHLNECCNQTEPLDTRMVDDYIMKLKSDKSIVSENGQAYLEAFVPTINRILKSPTYVIIDEAFFVCQLLEAILMNLTFDQILSIYPLEFIVEALESGLPHLATLALKIIAQSQPPDIFANTEIMFKMVVLFSDPDVSLKVIDAIEDCIVSLARGDLIRRRIVSKEIMSIFLNMKEKGTTTQKSRIMDLVIKILPYFKEGQLSSSLYQFSKDDCTTDDVMFIAMLNKFYTDMLYLIKDSFPSKDWLLRQIKDQIDIIAGLYSQRDENEDVKYFYINEIVQFFGVLSYVDVKEFRRIDSQFNITSNLAFREDYTILLLSQINPSVFIDKKDILRSIPVSAHTIPAIANLVSDEEVFEVLMQHQVSSDLLKKLPLNLLLKVLLAFTKMPFTTKYLINKMPSIMSILIDRDAIVVEPEALRLKKWALENLLANNTKEELCVWYNGIKESYDTITKGRVFTAIPTIHTLTG